MSRLEAIRSPRFLVGHKRRIHVLALAFYLRAPNILTYSHVPPLVNYSLLFAGVISRKVLAKPDSVNTETLLLGEIQR